MLLLSRRIYGVTVAYRGFRVKKLIFSISCLLLALGACREVPSDKLYALHLEQAPVEADWQRSLPRLVTVRGAARDSTYSTSL